MAFLGDLGNFFTDTLGSGFGGDGGVLGDLGGLVSNVGDLVGGIQSTATTLEGIFNPPTVNVPVFTTSPVAVGSASSNLANVQPQPTTDSDTGKVLLLVVAGVLVAGLTGNLKW